MKLNRMEIFLIFTLIVCISCKPFENSIENSNELMALIETDPNLLISDEDSGISNELDSDPFVYLKNINARIKKQLDLDNQNYDDDLNEDQYDSDSDSVSDESENAKETTDMNSRIIKSLSQDLYPTTSENDNKRLNKRNCHLSIGNGFVCHSYSMNDHNKKNKMIVLSKAPGK